MTYEEKIKKGGGKLSNYCYKIPVFTALGAIVSILVISILASLLRKT